MGSRCKTCGHKIFPPVADCPECLSPDFELVEYDGEGKLFTYSTIAAAPTGFEDRVPYTVAVVELEEGGRLLAWIGDSIPLADVQTIERLGTRWGKSPTAHLG